ncbi:hypothetical protein IQ240_12575 [Nodularia sp. LEGE 04288]|nr:hypothetical protein [Nodularia sp. LEGE 04288]
MYQADFDLAGQELLKLLSLQDSIVSLKAYPRTRGAFIWDLGFEFGKFVGNTDNKWEKSSSTPNVSCTAT